MSLTSTHDRGSAFSKDAMYFRRSLDYRPVSQKACPAEHQRLNASTALAIVIVHKNSYRPQTRQRVKRIVKLTAVQPDDLYLPEPIQPWVWVGGES
ncbi:hypothetical protein DICSQDRAFT_166936 [Dichomitus squalens LYAD-421 SS1]|uniref:uncharacterized protein n=1 Tax=Dichomitus squalens (strain LYAD-421) TaxID=732165 RepID=UPI000441502A|nr:uncharacterized protein DICSQDRAFT_166936 [Dichomitus squalens LYAD-421 SS1]EJF64780.1 hypothetical protein DICSQDRAFT_166936 [Dichomitus squalens LYAD-421 SS1]